MHHFHIIAPFCCGEVVRCFTAKQAVPLLPVIIVIVRKARRTGLG